MEVTEYGSIAAPHPAAASDVALSDFVELILLIVSVDIDPSTISHTTSLSEDLMLDSVSLISLMTLSEERFGVSLDGHAERVANIATVGDALALIQSLKG